jgi:hypothetical protein
MPRLRARLTSACWHDAGQTVASLLPIFTQLDGLRQLTSLDWRDLLVWFSSAVAQLWR